MARTLSRYRRGLLSRAKAAVELGAAALVVAPHPDDETLGCGGTIAKKIAAGADVAVVVLTDGGKSHRQLAPPSALAALRREEFQQATAALGVDRHAARMLDFPDGELQAHIPAAASQISAILRERMPRQIFIPYRHEPPSDHRAARAAALRALRHTQEAVTVYEYPVWFWARWPFVPFTAPPNRSLWRMAGHTLLANVRTYADFNCSQDVAMTVEDKRKALGCYRSQTSPMDDQPGWQTLNEVHGGAWLACMLRSTEYFHRYAFVDEHS